MLAAHERLPSSPLLCDLRRQIGLSANTTKEENQKLLSPSFSVVAADDDSPAASSSSSFCPFGEVRCALVASTESSARRIESFCVAC